MNKKLIKKRLQNYWPLCTAAAVIALVINHFGKASDADMLTWILTPTAGWVSVLSGIPFEYLPHQGYVNHFYQFLIAPSCAGGRFLLLTFLMLAFSFLPDTIQSDLYGKSEDTENDYETGNDNTKKNDMKKNMIKEYLWFGFSIVYAYISTVFVNGIRIVISIYLPGVLETRQLMTGLLTPDRLHTLIGTITYFTFLCVIYLLASFIRRCLFVSSDKKTAVPSKGILTCFTAYGRLFAPVFWYLLMVLALPFVKRIYLNEWEGFGQYAALIICVCGSVCAGFAVIGRFRKRHGK